ncbi:hypothetical protein PV04_07668 [Phialophora macrospora]|uniref:Fe2OG dioxygenase domain-containing protein n=1 Tax=Phialophora macrospora TaxID=1851006 RepID=A0A0D2FEY0_9EURO|nr:hypothetical protein PV04_07668 [Phialophora macrospora]
MASRQVPAISLKDFDNRKDEIREQLVNAAENTGFLTLVDHCITVEEIEAQFTLSKKFFDLPMDTKRKIEFTSDGLGYEYKGQKRILTGVDQKESLLIRRTSQWPSDEDVPDFRETTEKFLAKCAAVTQQVLSCFATALGFPEGYFKEPMDVSKPDCLNELRLLHYPASEKSSGWRAGAHTDFGCLTLLFQQDGGDGLEICPGRETHTSNARGDTFFPLPAKTGPIVVNIGDMLMSWSDDRFKANYHQVRAANGPSPSRYSIAYFNEGRQDFVFQGPQKK